MLCPDGPRRDSYRPLLSGNLGSDLREFIDEDEILVFDIMQPPGKLTKSEQPRKLVTVAKKQAKIWNGYCGFSTLITQISKIAEFSSSMTKLISQASGSSARKIRKKNLAKFFGEYNSHSGITLIV